MDKLPAVKKYTQLDIVRDPSRAEIIGIKRLVPIAIWPCDAKLATKSHDGKEIIIELISPDDYSGGFAVLKGFPYPANAVAM